VSRKIFYLCEICQSVMDEHNCKAICPNCGRMCDCSDLPVMQANGSVDESGDIQPRRGGERDFLPSMPNTPVEPPAGESGTVENLP